MKKILSAVLTAAIIIGLMCFAPAGAEADGSEELSITNNTGMFKAVSASLETTGGKTELVFALSGTGYKRLIRGTYEQAVALGSDTSGWINGSLNTAGKYEFRVPLSEGESYIPVVAVSESYYEGYLNGNNPIERSYYPRQLTIDAEAKTLVTGDYNETVTVKVISNLKSFRVEDTAQMSVTGGPNSNNYNVAPALVMKDDIYDQVKYSTVSGGKLTTVTADLETGNVFKISILNAPSLAAFKDKEPVSMQFRVKETGIFVERLITIDKLAGTITVDGDEIEIAEQIVSVDAGEYVFEPETHYRFTEGSFRVSGDAGVYSGGRDFYVTKSGSYTVTREK
ncbi:MAG: hypothetical protein IKR26_02980 [Lachnospiraceae bacterium]|nr:hypothetical protein [Lachnospiraceae bacterium]